MTEREIFLEALEMASPEARAAYLQGACGRDITLRRKVEELLKEHFSNDSLLAEPPVQGEPPTIKHDRPPEEAPAQMLGRYKLLEKIGEGGFGEVWMAEQREPIKRRVALKIIKLGMDSRQIVNRFAAERQALAMMDHPNIAKIFDAGTTESTVAAGVSPAVEPGVPPGGKGAAMSNAGEGARPTPGGRMPPSTAGETPPATLSAGRPYFVMELVRGIKITEYCDQNQLPTRERLRLFILVCQAIQHAHQKGIIHRDIKPSNILVTLHDGVPVPKVIDFGIAKATQQELTDQTVFTQFQQFIGTPAYISPEQAEMSGLDIDTRADIYSLGVLLYELLVGQTPFDAKEMVQGGLDALRQIIREKEPVRPSTKLNTMAGEARATAGQRRQTDVGKLVHQLQGDLDWIVMKCLEKDRTRRYDTANGLAMDIQRHWHNEPVLAGPPTARYRVKKFLRRHRTAAAIAAGFVLLLTAAATVSTRLAIWAHGEKEIADQQRAKALWAEGAANTSKGEAEKEARCRLDALTDMQIQSAEDFFTADDSARGVAHLASVLTSDPSNRVAAERLLSALTLRSFCLPVTEPLRHEGLVNSAQFSPDGLRVVTASFDYTARVWDAQTGKPLTEPLRHENEVVSARFSLDGLLVVTASADKTARIWDAQTGKLLTEPLRHAGWVSSAQFSPDGRQVVTASEDKTARAWDAQTGQPLTEPLRHASSVSSAQFSPDGRRVVTASADKTARVWDAQTGQPLTEPLRHEGPVRSAQFSPDGLRIVTASDDKTARVWNMQNGKPLTEPLRHASRVISAQFSPDGLRVVTASQDNAVRIWDSQTGTLLTEPLRHRDRVISAQFSQDGLRVVTASLDKTVRIWDSQTGMPLCEPLRHKDFVNSAQFSPDGLRVVTASHDKTARVWNVQNGKLFTEPLRHERQLPSAQFSPDGLRVVTASFDSTARVWDVQTGKPLTEPLRHESQVYSALFSPDGRRVVTASADKTAQVWDAQTGMPLSQPLQHEGPVQSAQFSPDGLRVVTASDDSTARVWEAQTGEPLTQLLGHGRDVNSAQFSRDGLSVVTASFDVGVWNARTGKLLTEPLRHAQYAVTSAEFSPDGRRVVTASFDCTARVWDAQTGQMLTEPFRHERVVNSAVFSPDGRRVITASDDRTARVWDAQTGKPITDEIRHENEVKFGQFSADGLRVVTASLDKTARVWDAQTGKPLTEPLRHEGPVRSAQFSPDGLRVVTASDDKTARVWETTFGSGPAPPWLPALAVAVAGKRLNGTAVPEPVGTEEFLQLKEQLSMAPATNYYTRWAKWFCADRATRTISPFSNITVPEYVRRRLAENSLDSLREAVRLTPNNALTLARFARQVLSSEQDGKPVREAEADFLSHRAVTLAPNDPEVARLRTYVLEHLSQHAKP